MITDLRYEFFLSWRQVYLSALSLYAERLWICEVDIKTFVLVQSYNRFFVLIIKWGKLILRFVLITLALLLGFQVIFINVAFHSCRSSGLFFWEDFRAYWYSPTSIIRISRLSILFFWSQICHEYPLVMIKIRRHIPFKTTALKSEEKATLFRFQNAKTCLERFVTNEEHSNEVWLAYSCFVAKWDFTLYWLVRRGTQDKLHSVTNV